MIATQNAADKTQKFLDDFKVSKPVIGLPGLGWDCLLYTSDAADEL